MARRKRLPPRIKAGPRKGQFRRKATGRKRKRVAKRRNAAAPKRRRRRRKVATARRRPARRRVTRRRTVRRARRRNAAPKRRRGRTTKSARSRASKLGWRRKRARGGRKLTRRRRNPGAKTLRVTRVRRPRRKLTGAARTSARRSYTRRRRKASTRGLRHFKYVRGALKGRRRVGSLTKAYGVSRKFRANRRRRSYRRRRRNPMSFASFKELLPKAAWALGGFLGTRALPAFFARYAPSLTNMVAGVAGRFTPVVVSGVSLAVSYYLGERFIKQGNKHAFILGAGVAFLETALQAVLPPSILATIGLAPPMAVMSPEMAGYWAEGIAPIGSRGLSDYVRTGALEGEYVPTGTPTLGGMGAYVEEPLSGLGEYFQSVAGMGFDVEEAVAGMGMMNRPWGSLQQYPAAAIANARYGGGMGLEVNPVAQSGCVNCNMNSVMPESMVPASGPGWPLAAREAALQKAGQVTRGISLRPPREMLGVRSCGIYGSTIWE